MTSVAVLPLPGPAKTAMLPSARTAFCCSSLRRRYSSLSFSIGRARQVHDVFKSVLDVVRRTLVFNLTSKPLREAPFADGFDSDEHVSRCLFVVGFLSNGVNGGIEFCRCRRGNT